MNLSRLALTAYIVAIVIIVVDQFTKERYWKDTSTGVFYRRIVGGFCWPFDTSPGAFCVLGEVRSVDQHTYTHRVVLLHDEEVSGVDELLRRVHSASVDTGVFDWIARRDVSEVRFVDQFNRLQSAQRQRQIRLVHPQEGDDRDRFRFWIRLLERRTMDDKTMTFGESACVRSGLRSPGSPCRRRTPAPPPAPRRCGPGCRRGRESGDRSPSPRPGA